MFKFHIITCILFYYTTSISGFVSEERSHQTSSNAIKENCECVPTNLCDRNDIVGTSGEGKIDVRIGSGCPGNTVCCKQPKQPTNVSADRALDNVEPGAAQPKQTTDVSADRALDNVEPGATTSQQCGIRNSIEINPNIDPRISSTSPATAEAGFGEFPWMVGVLTNEEDGFELFVCGASLIRQNVVLTAAHCVHQFGAPHIKIHAGDWDIEAEVETPPPQKKTVSRIIIHPDFNNRSMKHDIALLVLTSPVIYTEKVAPVCLPRRGIAINATHCIVNGWGKDKFEKDGRYQNILKKTVLPLVEHNECQTRLRTTRLGRYFKLHESFVCGGGELNVDACQGDGGGPLVCSVHGSDSSTYVQVGIVSWGIGCRGTIPAVYNNVYTELPWITEQLANIT